MALTKTARRTAHGLAAAALTVAVSLAINGTLTTSKQYEGISVMAAQWTDQNTTRSATWFRHVSPATCSKCAARLRIFAIALQLKLM